jgi:hypothetical protein
MKTWASKSSIRAEIADTPEGWLDRFAAARPNDIRKFGDSRNSMLLFRTSAVLEAIEQGLYFRTAGGAA